jgi:hypothetical protein
LERLARVRFLTLPSSRLGLAQQVRRDKRYGSGPRRHPRGIEPNRFDLCQAEFRLLLDYVTGSFSLSISRLGHIRVKFG